MSISSKLLIAALAAATFATAVPAFAGGDAAPRNKFVAPSNTGIIIVTTTGVGGGGKVTKPPQKLVETQQPRRCTPANPC